MENTSPQFDKETLEYITPFALNIHPSLLGIPLARPVKRLLALLIDILIIAVLSTLNSFLLAGALIFLFIRLGGKKSLQNSLFSEDSAFKPKSLAHSILLGVGLTVIAIAVALGLYSKFSDESSKPTTIDDVTIHTGMSIDEIVQMGRVLPAIESRIAKTQCTTLECWKDLLNTVAIELEATKMSEDAKLRLLQKYIHQSNLPKEDQQTLHSSINSSITGQSENDDLGAIKPNNPTNEISTPPTQADDNSFSLIGWLKGILNDLGLSFGWATFYFTIFISYWHGQTPGKRLLRIKVIQINATPISLWDSFGRYGGYAAGLSTGLLGFLQIFWDPNRQAIQDKISATFVIDLKKQRRK